jgi:ribonuclease J
MKKKEKKVNITVHRGLEQIGGCITEISTATSRVFIDMGQNLPGQGEKTTPEQDQEMVEGLFAKNRKQYEAVFYTHAHEDHVGLFRYVPDEIPQYIGHGGYDLLMEKYQVLREGHKMNLENRRKRVEKGIDILDSMMESAMVEIIKKDDELLRKLQNFNIWERPKPHAVPKTLSVGDIRITPFFNCHSIYDSYMFLIEAGGQRIWHMGDYREHGYMGKGLVPTLKRYATDIDVLITEGTLLGYEAKCMHEREVSRKMACVMDAFRYVVVLASATDVERLASINSAAQKVKKDVYICSEYMKRTMRIFTREAELSKGLFEFHPKFVSRNSPKVIASMRKKGFVLVAGAYNASLAYHICEGLNPSEVLFIYSTWPGYYQIPEQEQLNSNYADFRDMFSGGTPFSNVLDIHTSGHADRATIKKVVEIVNAKEVICIHKDVETEMLF